MAVTLNEQSLVAAFERAKNKALAPVTAQIKARQKKIVEIQREVDRLEKLQARIVGQHKSARRPALAAVTAAAASPSKSSKRSGRARRSPDQLHKLAKEIHDFVASKGSSGASGAEIKRKFKGIVGPTNAFVTKYHGQTMRTKGRKRSMVYYA